MNMLRESWLVVGGCGVKGIDAQLGLKGPIQPAAQLNSNEVDRGAGFYLQTAIHVSEIITRKEKQLVREC